jgi:GH3 auxin-responsive promoter
MNAAGLLWAAANAPGWMSFRRALRDPRRAQEERLRAILARNAVSAFGRAHGFHDVTSLAAFQRRVPLQDWDDVRPWVDRISQGETSVLTSEPVRVLESTGGSTAAKRIPYTASLQAEFRAAISPWIFDLYRRRPRLLRGLAYWSITPIVTPPAAGAVPIGFDDDAAYLGARWQRLVDATLAVPSAVRHVADLEAFRYVTLRFLLQARDLALVSVWHPSFLTLLLDALGPHFEALLRDLHDGTLTAPAPLGERLRATLLSRLRASPVRSREVEAAGPEAPTRIWTRLALVSCWADGHASQLLPALRARLPGVEIQPKGLLATEGCVTIPFEGAQPLAIRAHVFEFLEGEDARLSHELEVGHRYSVVLTTGGGLYRYRLHDLVEVTGRLEQTPTLRFLGKEEQVADLVGEKLEETFVARCLQGTLGEVGAGFAVLAPDRTASPAGYTLYLDHPPPETLALRLEVALAEHGDYRYARALGQLAAVRVFQIEGGGGAATYLEACRRTGQRLGDVKPLALSRRDDWSGVFAGRYSDA